MEKPADNLYWRASLASGLLEVRAVEVGVIFFKHF
jgi:hypothetical protein